jgi:hypothetical protein
MTTFIKTTPEPITVLDKGYVRLVDTLGTDLSIVNAARVSYDKESTEFTARDEKLISFLIREGHTSPFRHAALTFRLVVLLASLIHEAGCAVQKVLRLGGMVLGLVLVGGHHFESVLVGWSLDCAINGPGCDGGRVFGCRAWSSPCSLGLKTCPSRDFWPVLPIFRENLGCSRFRREHRKWLICLNKYIKLTIIIMLFSYTHTIIFTFHYD